MDDDKEDEVKKLREEIERLKKEIEDLKKGSTMMDSSKDIITAFVETFAELPKMIQREVSRSISTVIPQKQCDKVVIFPFKDKKMASDHRSELNIEKEIEMILDESLPKSDGITESMDVDAGLSDLIKKMDPTEISDAMVVLANPDRIRILQFLYEKDRYFSELEEHLRLGPSSLRHHLSKLLDGGLVIQERSRGKYSISKRGVAALILIAYLYDRILKKV